MEHVLRIFNTDIMPRFRSGHYRLSCDQEISPGCLYFNELPSPDAQVLSMHDACQCVGSITFQPCMLIRDSIEIFSFTTTDRRRRGINLVLRMFAILLIRSMYPDARYIVSYAEAEASVVAARRLGFQKYPDKALEIFVLPMDPCTFDRIGRMLIDQIVRSQKNKTP